MVSLVMVRAATVLLSFRFKLKTRLARAIYQIYKKFRRGTVIRSPSNLMVRSGRWEIMAVVSSEMARLSTDFFLFKSKILLAVATYRTSKVSLRGALSHSHSSLMEQFG